MIFVCDKLKNPLGLGVSHLSPRRAGVRGLATCWCHIGRNVRDVHLAQIVGVVGVTIRVPRVFKSGMVGLEVLRARPPRALVRAPVGVGVVHLVLHALLVDLAIVLVNDFGVLLLNDLVGVVVPSSPREKWRLVRARRLYTVITVAEEGTRALDVPPLLVVVLTEARLLSRVVLRQPDGPLVGLETGVGEDVGLALSLIIAQFWGPHPRALVLSQYFSFLRRWEIDAPLLSPPVHLRLRLPLAVVEHHAGPLVVGTVLGREGEGLGAEVLLLGLLVRVDSA
mmetsp:Transcript_4711/g.8041  ORF Transcript_4711/g.8041 Transcript_4711/m.8041 type:complete len:281 (-) Transcript_4711:439-1281(-)